MNDKLKAKEESDYFNRIESIPEQFTYEEFINKQFSFGALSIISNIKDSAEDIYLKYKSRIEVDRFGRVLGRAAI